jgi:hypothetical protein
MNRFRLQSSAIFLLFFGVAVLASFQSGNWLKAAFWLVTGFVFVWADNLRKPA